MEDMQEHNVTNQEPMVHIQTGPAGDLVVNMFSSVRGSRSAEGLPQFTDEAFPTAGQISGIDGDEVI